MLALALPGLELKFGAIGLGVALRAGCVELFVRVHGFGMGNPPGFDAARARARTRAGLGEDAEALALARARSLSLRYPHEDFLSARHLILGLQLPLAAVWHGLHVAREFAAGRATWSPFPGEAAALAAAPGFAPLRAGVLRVTQLQVDDVSLNFCMYRDKFNLNELIRRIAAGKVERARRRGPPLNCLRVKARAARARARARSALEG